MTNDEVIKEAREHQWAMYPMVRWVADALERACKECADLRTRCGELDRKLDVAKATCTVDHYPMAVFLKESEKNLAIAIEALENIRVLHENESTEKTCCNMDEIARNALAKINGNPPQAAVNNET